MSRSARAGFPPRAGGRRAARAGRRRPTGAPAASRSRAARVPRHRGRRSRRRRGRGRSSVATSIAAHGAARHSGDRPPRADRAWRGGQRGVPFRRGAARAGAGAAGDGAPGAGSDRPLRRRHHDGDDDRRAAAGRDRRSVRADRRRRRGGGVSARADRRAGARAARGARGGRAGAGAGGGVRRLAAAGLDAGRDLPAGGVRAAGAAVGLLQAHGLRPAAHAAGDRAAGDGGRRGSAAARWAWRSGRS